MSTESVSVPGWGCGLCGAVHGTKDDADRCCTCTGCGAKFQKSASYDSRCDSCDYGQDLRSARDACERAERDLKNTHERLKRLIDNPPAGKKRPKLGAPPMPPIPCVPYVHPDGTVDPTPWAPLYEARDFLADLATSLAGHTELADECRDMSEKVTRGIKDVGGGTR
jgi:hypothetical protein